MNEIWIISILCLSIVIYITYFIVKFRTENSKSISLNLVSTDTGLDKDFERVRSLLNNLNKVSRYQHNSKEKKIKLNHLLRKSVNKILVESQLSNIIELDYKSDEVVIFANEENLQRAIYEVLGNAISSIENKVKLLKEGYEKPRLSIQLLNDKESQCIRLVIEDNGLGMASREREYVFDPSRSLELESNGLGEGLYLSKTLFRLCQGDLQYRSDLNEKTVAEVVLNKKN